MRIVCPGAGFRDLSMRSDPVVAVQEPDLGRIFGVTSYNDKIFAVNGPSLPMVQIRGKKKKSTNCDLRLITVNLIQLAIK